MNREQYNGSISVEGGVYGGIENDAKNMHRRNSFSVVKPSTENEPQQHGNEKKITGKRNRTNRSDTETNGSAEEPKQEKRRGANSSKTDDGESNEDGESDERGRCESGGTNQIRIAGTIRRQKNFRSEERKPQRE